jgi:hypothetical protein
VRLERLLASISGTLAIPSSLRLALYLSGSWGRRRVGTAAEKLDLHPAGGGAAQGSHCRPLITVLKLLSSASTVRVEMIGYYTQPVQDGYMVMRVTVSGLTAQVERVYLGRTFKTRREADAEARRLKTK